MKRGLLLGGAVLALCSTFVMAQDAPESLLPPGFDEPTPTPAPAPAPSAAPAPAPTRSTGTAAPSTPAQPSVPNVQPIPSGPSASSAPSPSRSTGGSTPAGARLPSLSELEALDPDELDELLGLKPRYDIPPAARRAMTQVGVLSREEGGLPFASLANQPESLVRASLTGIKGPLISRWGHIMARRAYASRLTAPSGMEPAEFAGLRAAALNTLGEYRVSRALVQDVDTGNWDDAMTDAGLEAYIATSDITGACPVVQSKGGERDDPQWKMLQSICYAFAGQGARSQANLNNAFRDKIAPQIDVLLAQRYAGAAGQGRRAINVEWDGVEDMNPWRYSLAVAVGAELPENLQNNDSPYYRIVSALNPALPLAQRVAGSQIAAERGIFSSRAMVNLYSRIAASSGVGGDAPATAAKLRDAYVASDPLTRIAAMRDVWGGTEIDYGRMVVTAYAAARITPSEDLNEHAEDLIASMLTAGLDADALSWGTVVAQGTPAWGLLALAQPDRPSPVSEDQVDSYYGNDESANYRKSAFFVAGLAGLGRIESDVQAEYDEYLELGFGRQTRWSELISQAADVNNPALVAFLAAAGMQGESWDQMTPRHLFHIVSALSKVGMTAEARMIAAEAVARS